MERRARVLDNEETFERFAAFLADSPARYHWFGRRFVLMPDHLHLIAHMGTGAVRLGEWIKAMKAVVGGLARLPERNENVAGRMPGVTSGDKRIAREFTRVKRTWSWQKGFHDHIFRTHESESKKWEYICLNPVRSGLVQRPEAWPYGGEIFYDFSALPQLIRGTPSLLETGILIEVPNGGTPGEGTRPTT